MSVFEVVCLVATGILLWSAVAQAIHYTILRILPLDDVALQGKPATQDVISCNHIRPPPLPKQKKSTS
jgi:hypothetical protein